MPCDFKLCRNLITYVKKKTEKKKMKEKGE